MKYTLYLSDEMQTQALGQLIGEWIKKPSVVALSGDLGTGKTSLTQGIAKALTIEDPITSPTFTLLNSYRGLAGNLYHIDTYRLSDPVELFELGLEDCLQDQNGMIVIEWAERLLPYLESVALQVHLSYEREGRQAFLTIDAQNTEFEAKLNKLSWVKS